VRKDQVVRLDFQDQLVPQDLLVLQVLLDFQDNKDLKVASGLQDQQDH
jgi:hypothetical protein